MGALADNKLHPLEIADARQAAFRASEMQRECETRLKDTSKKLAEAERTYRRRLSIRILELHAGDGDTAGLAITTCETVAKGEKDVSQLRYLRDVAAGIFEAAKQESFRRGADRRDVNQLLHWSEARDLRTDAPPAPGQEEPPIGHR